MLIFPSALSFRCSLSNKSRSRINKKLSLLIFAFLLLSLMCPPVKSLVDAVASKQGGAARIAVHWFRLGDMRLHDNQALQASIHYATKEGGGGLLPVFCFDPRIFGNHARSENGGELKCGPKRAQFVLESVADLRHNLEKKGSGLIVAHEKPEAFLQSLLLDQQQELFGQSPRFKIFCQEEVCKEERDVVKAVKSSFRSPTLVDIESVWGSTLYDIDDLPYDTTSYLSDMPDTFTPFRNKVEKKATIHIPKHVPSKLASLPFSKDGQAVVSQHLSYLPTLTELGYNDEQTQDAKQKQCGDLEFKGGETAALARVKDYIWDKDLLKVYFDTRNGMLGADYSSKFAPWLAHGNLSPRLVANECKKYEEIRGIVNKSTYWLVFELLWRDFFKFFALKHGNSIFFPGGTIHHEKNWPHYEKNVQAWKTGKTGFPLVDANMRELAATGFMSNRGRQNVCSFLALDLNQDWRYGAEYFENILLDYDVYSNWGNWCAGAGMTGGRLNRFNIVKQSKDYDQHGDYVRYWLPELKDVPKEFVHEPWKMNHFQQKQYNCQLGVDYPNPITQPFSPSKKTQRGGKSGGGGKSTSRNNNGNNPNRGRGQRQDMKSLKKGSYEFRG